ncbi:glycosyltransferase [candidate division KSB1 bacterium]|nr:glycosyltransferase [candidate division KSB1 bacterium]
MSVKVSIVMPCLNEHKTIGICIKKAQETLEKLKIAGEIIIADNGSTDGSDEIARSLGAKVIYESKRGYGNAYRAGIQAALGEYIVMGDSDDSYDFTDLGRFVLPLEEGADFVIGTRFRGNIEKGAMPWLHRYIGNPVLTGILNLMYHSKISDAHCGMRSFKKSAYKKMNLQTTGMEFASEMVIKAIQLGLKIEQVPITLYRDGRGGPPHLRSFRDGWRHLRFMLLYSPTYLYSWPGTILFVMGLVMLISLLPGPLYIAGRFIDLHVMVLGSMFTILGFQIINLGFYARIYAATHKFVPETPGLKKLFKLFNLERGLLVGAVIFLAGFGTDFYILIKWILNDFGALDEVRLALFASTFIIIGAQTIFSSFFLSMIGIQTRSY